MYLLAEMQLAEVDSRFVCASADAGNQRKASNSCVPRSAVLVIKRRLLKLENAAQ